MNEYIYIYIYIYIYAHNFEYAKGVIKNRKSKKNRQYHGQKKRKGQK